MPNFIDSPHLLGDRHYSSCWLGIIDFLNCRWRNIRRLRRQQFHYRHVPGADAETVQNLRNQGYRTEYDRYRSRLMYMSKWRHHQYGSNHYADL